MQENHYLDVLTLERFLRFRENSSICLHPVEQYALDPALKQPILPLCKHFNPNNCGTNGERNFNFRCLLVRCV